MTPFDLDVVQLSRLQFGLTAMYHFLFVPLTLGLALLLGIMESVYVMTGREIWRQMTKFWGVLFGINFAMGVATGITMEFQFGMNWAYYSHYVGDVFGAPLAIEGLMAFFLEATFVGLFFFGWDRLSKVGPSLRHLAGRARLESLGALDPDRQRLDAASGRRALQSRHHAHGGHRFHGGDLQPGRPGEVRPHRQRRLRHRRGLRAGDQRASIFCAARHVEIAKRSMTVAASFGLAAALSVVVLGDESGYTATENQKMKIAAIEAMWETEPAPASFTLFGMPNMETQHHRLCSAGAVDAGPDRHPLDQTRRCPASRSSSRAPSTASGAASSPMTRSRSSRRTGTTPKQRNRLEQTAERSRLRAAPQEDPSRHRQRHRRRDHAGRVEHRAARLAALLELPLHGRARLLLHRPVRRRLLPRYRRGASEVIAAVPVDGASSLAASLDRRRARLVSSPKSDASPG